MKENSMTRDHGGGIIGRRSIEKNSLRRNRGGGIMEEQSTVGFSPSLSKDIRKLNIEYYHFFVHGTHEIFQSVSKESENMVSKLQKIHVRSSILTCFWAQEPPQGRPRDHAGMGP